jgi:hypothetical protein
MSSRQSIANYTTTIEVDKTVAEITRLLAGAKATAILSEYNDGAIAAISFRIATEFGFLTFRLPAQIEGVHTILIRSPKIPRSLRTLSQARRVAWRIVLHWLDAQLAMIAAGLVRFDQVFLPFAQDPAGVTLYERMREAKFSGLLLEQSEESRGATLR